MYMDDIKLLKKKRIGNSNTRSENIQSGHRDEIWHRKMRHANNEKWEMKHDGMELPNQEKKEKMKPTNTWEYWKQTPSNK